MFCSMTGYGEAARENQALRVGFRVRGVNHKGLDVQLRLPLDFSYLESDLRNLVKNHVFRGRIDIFSEIEVLDPALAPPVRLDQAKFHQLVEASTRMANHPSVQGTLDVNTLIRMHDLFTTRRVGFRLPEQAAALISQTLEEALARFVANRAQEGDGLATELTSRLESVSKNLALVSEDAQARRGELKSQILSRLELLASDMDVDESRLYQEVVYHADRLDVTEEITRLGLHLEKGLAMLAKPSRPMGKALEFLLQEMSREVTTLGNKAKHMGIAQKVVFLKTELEKVREQVLNIE